LLPGGGAALKQNCKPTRKLLVQHGIEEKYLEVVVTNPHKGSQVGLMSAIAAIAGS